MKKKYAGLVDVFNILAVLVFLIGAVAVLFGILGRNPTAAFTLGASAVLTTVLLSAAAAVIDLLATIELNTRTTAAYFERRLQPTDSNKQAELPANR